MAVTTLSVLGVAGGVGATRLSVELGAALARDGRNVAVLDAAFDTQGLAGYVDARLDPDLTAVLTDDAPLGAALVELDVDATGRLALAPAHAAFERVARAKAPEAARALDATVEEAADMFDAVVVDTPPVASNPAVASVTAADVRAAIVPPTKRGRDALQRERGRLEDVGTAADAVVANRVPGEVSLSEADYEVPTAQETDVPETPTCAGNGGGFAVAVAETAAGLFDTDIDVEYGGGAFDAVRRRFR